MSQVCLFRLTMDEFPVTLKDKLLKYDLKFIVREIGGETGKVHFQGVVVSKIATIRKIFEREVGGGNRLYSVKLSDNEERTVQYLCKGASETDDPDVVYNVGFDTDTLHMAYWLENSLVKSSGKRKRHTNLLDDCYEGIKERLHADTAAINVGTEIVKWYLDQRIRLPSSFAMGSMISTYIARLNNDSGLEITPDLFRRLYPNLGF